MIFTTTQDAAEEHEGFFTSAEAMKLQSTLAERSPVTTAPGEVKLNEGRLPEWIGPAPEEGRKVVPIMEVFHEHGDPKGIWTVRIYSGSMTERGAARLYWSMDCALAEFKKFKRKERKQIAKMGPKVWKKAPARPKDTLMMIGWSVINEETGTADLAGVPWSFFPAWDKKETEELKVAAWRALAEMVAMSQAQEQGLQ